MNILVNINNKIFLQLKKILIVVVIMVINNDDNK